MTQAKKTAQPSAKLASNKESASFGGGESARNSAENVIRMGGSAMKDFIASSADEAQKAQEKIFSIGRDSAEQFTKSADACGRFMSEMASMSRGGVETCMECGNLTASMAKDMGNEAFEYASQAFSDGLELSKEFFACRTLSDMFDLQNRAIRGAIDNFFNQSVKMSGMMFEYSTEALEPINERVSEAAEHFSKALSA